MAVLFTQPYFQAFDNDGNPLSGGRLFTFSAGTNTPKRTFTTEDSSVEHANPVVLDSAGRATIFIDGSYRYRLEDADGNVIRTVDNVTSFINVSGDEDPFFESFSGDGTQTVFTLSEDLGVDEKTVMIFVDGGSAGFEIQAPGDYTLDKTSLTFNTAPASGTQNIYVFAPSKIVGAATSAADAAASSATAAAASATDAATAETAAETAQTNAETAETNAEGSATAASTSETNAAASESAAATSETNAAASETAAATSETNAANSASAASTSETNAANSASAASTSETNAASSASAAATSATDAADSATTAQTAAIGVTDARDDARDWASEAEDTTVSDGVNPDGFSAFHWSEKAKDARDAALAAVQPIDTVTETITSSAVDFNLNSALYYIVNVDQDFTATFSGLASGVTNNAYIELINAGDHTVTWTNAAWDGGSEAPLLGQSSAFDLTAASFDSVSFDVSSEEGNPFAIHFKPDGTRMYMVGIDLSTVYQYTLSTAWDLNTASYDNVSFNVSSEESKPTSIHFKQDGTKMYMVGLDTKTVYQYTLSTAWDLSTASYDNVSFGVGSEDPNPYSVHFKPDGTKMYMSGASIKTVYQYTLSTAWDLSTASYDNVSFGVGSEDPNPYSVHFKPDGTKMYVASNSAGKIDQYTLSTPWDLSTASYDNVSFDVSSEDSNPTSIHFKQDGTKMYMVNNLSDTVYQYSTGQNADQSTLIEAIAQDDGTTPVKLRKIWDEA